MILEIRITFVALLVRAMALANPSPQGKYSNEGRSHRTSGSRMSGRIRNMMNISRIR